LGSGWFQCTIVGGKTNAATGLAAYIFPAASDSGGGGTYAGVANAHSIAIFRATLAQSGVPTQLSQSTASAVAGAAQSGQTLNLKGLPASTNGLLLPGDFVQSGNDLILATSALNSDALGLGVITLYRPPRNGPADSSPLIVNRPMGRFILTTNDQSYVHYTDNPGYFTDHAVELEESMDV